MKNFCFIFFFVFITAQSFSQETTAQSKTTIDVSVTTFKQLIDSLEGEVLVDLRTPEELRAGKIPGAVVINFFGDDFEPAIKALDPDKTYLLYCASGGRSGETAQLLEEMGFRKIYTLESGFNGWTKAKMPVSRKK